MKPLRVFIVEDDPDFAESLAMVLEGRDYDVVLAGSGEEAIKRFQEEDFDVTLMDIRLPGKNGVESFLEIRKMKPDAKVIMMTGFSVEQLIRQAVDNGAYAVFHKPLNIDEILETIEKIKPYGILVVDDNLDFVASINELLSGLGYNVYVCNRGEDAIRRIAEGGIDILILDLRLPEMSGLEIFLELKNRDLALPTIIVTAYANDDQGDIARLRSMSVGKILRKPFNPQELLTTLKKLVDATDR
jgi:two-component system, NtrC family, response regulator HydG